MSKVAIITGASGNGIGRSTALTLAREKYNIVINYLSNENKANEISKLIQSNGGKAISVRADIFNQAECDQLINETIFEYGRIDVCIIGPGAGWNPESPDRLKSKKALQDVIQEVSPIYYLVPRLIPEMKKNGQGRIIAIASNKRFPSPSYSYNTAKNARIEAMQGLVTSCWKNGITINLVSPGPVDHIDQLQDAIDYTRSFPIESKKVIPQDIAELISFLCSDKARYVTGNTIELGF